MLGALGILLPEVLEKYAGIEFGVSFQPLLCHCLLQKFDDKLHLCGLDSKQHLLDSAIRLTAMLTWQPCHALI